MRIVNVELTELKSAGRRGRTRSPETLQLIKAIESLKTGEAKAIVVESGQTAAKVRAKLMYVAKAIDVKLQVAIKDDRVMFARQARRGRPRKS